MRSDRAALDQGMRRPPHDLTILERAGLRLVRVADEIVRLPVAGLHEAPLHARGEPCTTTAAQSRVFHELHDFSGLHRERLLERSVAATPAPAVQPDGLALADLLQKNHRLPPVRLVPKPHLSL